MSLPGSALAISMYSLNVLALKFGLTTRTLGLREASEMWMKSAIGSKSAPP